MPLLNFKNKSEAQTEKKIFLSKQNKIILIVALIVVALGYAGAFVWTKSYEKRIVPNVWLGENNLGGLTSEEAKRVINTNLDKIIAGGLQLSVDGTLGTIPLSPTSPEAADYVVFDTNRAVEEALKSHRSDLPALQPFKILYASIIKTKIQIPIEINKEKFSEIILKIFPQSIQLATDAGFAFKQIDEIWSAEVTPSANGLTIPVDQLFSQIKQQLAVLDAQPIVLSRAVEKPKIFEADIQGLVAAAEAAVNAAPFSFSLEEQVWNIEAADLITSIKPTFDQENKITLSISTEGLTPLFEKIAAEVEKSAVDARLIMENGRVVDFQASANGATIDREKTAAALSEIIRQPENKISCPLTINVVEPNVKMENVNDLGIKEILGAGTSSYKGSPTNRVKNIRNGVRLLNGLLIKPSEEFSLLAALRPFDQGNGYLPELVIKGDKIEPEVGGGLCQIGTTTFRATMNSGLPITARQNHSLVVSYYNDPSNNNPGTDATIYDPAPDFKFINDTGNYLLFQAEMDETARTLKFSFWGTPDGRRGSYTPPTLIRWIPVGEEVRTETTDLEPGKEKCQEAHVGADTTFTYTVEKPDETKTETVFDSHYRPLAKICLVGVKELTTTEEETTPESETSTASETTE